jgi:hypothetical protein
MSASYSGSVAFRDPMRASWSTKWCRGRILREDSPPVGGYGDLGTRTIAVIVTSRALRAVAGYLAARQHSHDETVSLVVQIDDPDTRREETLTYKAAPGQSTVEAAVTALRALPGVGEALERSLWWGPPATATDRRAPAETVRSSRGGRIPASVAAMYADGHSLRALWRP